MQVLNRRLGKSADVEQVGLHAAVNLAEWVALGRGRIIMTVMSKRKPSKPKAKADSAPQSSAAEAEQIAFASSNLSLHDLFQQQAAAMLARSDIDEEAKQQILVAMACPCCGAGAMSYTVKLKK